MWGHCTLQGDGVLECAREGEDFLSSLSLALFITLDSYRGVVPPGSGSFLATKVECSIIGNG